MWSGGRWRFLRVCDGGSGGRSGSLCRWFARSVDVLCDVLGCLMRGEKEAGCGGVAAAVAVVAAVCGGLFLEMEGRVCLDGRHDGRAASSRSWEQACELCWACGCLLRRCGAVRCKSVVRCCECKLERDCGGGWCRWCWSSSSSSNKQQQSRNSHKQPPQINQEYPLNLSISVSGGKETNKDSHSNGE